MQYQSELRLLLAQHQVNLSWYREQCTLYEVWLAQVVEREATAYNQRLAASRNLPQGDPVCSPWLALELGLPLDEELVPGLVAR
jgi:hypothetical protein